MSTKNAPAPRVVLYGRTSLDSSEGRSVDDQLASLRRWADGSGREVVAALRDDGISASRYGKGKARPDWTTAMELITDGMVDELAVWEVSRSTRDRPVWAALIAACIENDVNLAVDGKVHDPADADDGFMLDLGAALAVRESAVISKRTRRGVESRAAAGRPHGSLPYGYACKIDPNTGHTIGRIEDPVQAPILREIVGRLLAGESAQSIARDLNARGARTRRGSEWRGTNLGAMVTRPAYAGLRVHHGTVLDSVTATWPPLISLTDHRRLVAMFADPDRDRFRNTKVSRHLGTGLFRCGIPTCDGTMRVVVGATVGRNDRYDCRKCHRVSRNQADVDDVVTKLLVARLSQPDVLELLADTSHDDEVKAAAAEVVQLKEQLRATRERVDAGELTIDDLVFFRRRWEKRLEEAERRSRPRHVPDAVFDVAGPEAAIRWAEQPIGMKRVILDALYTVTIHPAGKGHWRFDPDLIEIMWRGRQR